MKKLLFSVLLFLALSPAVRAEERITSFDVTLQVQTDGSLIVTENIALVAEHNQIKRGIYRDIPQTRQNPVNPISLTMDGQAHPYFTERNGNALRINFGDDNYIPLGQHIYSFKYSVARAVGQFKNYDEIYWNITGNYWNFPIEQAAATVILPTGAYPIENKISLYTGRRGDKGKDAVQTAPLTFAVTRQLNQGEGFTVAVPWQKGIVTFPQLPWQERPAFIVTLALAALWIYFYLAWLLVGRDPQKRVVRQYAPPKDISPAFARYLGKMGFENKNFAVILISMALKGAIKISQKQPLEALSPEAQNSFVGKLLSAIKGPYVLHAQEIGPNVNLSKEELAVYNSFFSGIAKQVTLTQSSRTGILLAIKAARKTQEQQEGKSYFKANSVWIMPTLLPMGLFAFKMAQIDPETLFFLFFFGFFFTILTGIIIGAVRNFKRFSFFAILPLVIAGWFFINFFTAISHNFGALSVLDPDLLWYGFGVAVLIVSSYIFGYLIRAYSVAGRAVMDEVEGFKQYLAAAEEHRAAVSDPTDAQKMFCDYFAYAVALDVENEWINGFEAALGAAVVQQSLNNRGIHASGIGTAAGLSAFGGALSSAVASSSSSSGSGSGGGGSSGGGGGGGGGGGR